MLNVLPARLGLAVILAVFAVVSILPASAWRKKPVFDNQHLNLINTLIAHPELMNISYLQYVIGSPENGRSQMGRVNKSYFWYEEPGRQLAYQLDQQGPQPGVVTHSRFTINIPQSRIRLADVEKLYGNQHRHVFDNRSNPVKVYSVSPTTYVAFTEPIDTFRIKHVTVGYTGPPLPRPAAEDVRAAYNMRRSKALVAAQNGDYHRAIPWLQTDVRLQPGNPTTHLALADAYRGQLMLNEAITEYSTALRLSAGHPEVTEKCLQALTQLKMIPGYPKKADRRSGAMLAGAGAGL